jgi:hypothetical protein
MSMPCPVGSFRPGGPFLFALPILVILGPYLPRLHLSRISHILKLYHQPLLLMLDIDQKPLLVMLKTRNHLLQVMLGEQI